MMGIVEERLDDLGQLCRKFRVKRLDLFGSAATHEFDPVESDLDFLVEFQPDEDMNPADQYFGLLEELERLFGRGVDLVMVRAMRNPYFIEAVNKTRRTVYAAQVA
jgi:hypothetical protein